MLLKLSLLTGLSLITLGAITADEAVPKKPGSDFTIPPKTWPMFGGSPDRNMVNHLDKNLPVEVDVEKNKNVLWFAELGSQSYGNPVIADGKVYVGTNNGNPRDAAIKGDKGNLMAFRTSDGRFLWQIVHDKLPAGRVNDWPEQGVCSSPLIEGDKVYYVSNRGELICASTEGLAAGNKGVTDETYKGVEHGDIIWRLDMMKDLAVFQHNMAACSPISVGDILLIITGNGHDESHENIPSPQAPSFIGVNKSTGKVIWTSNLPGNKILHGQWSNPCYAVIGGQPQAIFCGGDSWMYSFDPKDGKLLWKFDCNPKNSVYKLGGKGTKNEIIGTPIVYEGKIYLAIGQDPEHGDGVGHMWCIDPAGKTGDISPVNDNFDPKAPENKNSGLVWHYGGVDDKGELKWHRSMSTMAVHNGLCYICTLHGFVSCFDAKTGQLYWTHDTLSNIWGSCYVADGKVYIGTEEGDLLVFQEGKELKLLAKNDMKGSILSSIVSADGVLYVMTKNRLYALKNK